MAMRIGDRRATQYPFWNSRFGLRCPPGPCGSEFLWHERVAAFLTIEIYDEEFLTPLYFALAQIMQERTPSWILLQIIRDTSR